MSSRYCIVVASCRLDERTTQKSTSPFRNQRGLRPGLLSFDEPLDFFRGVRAALLLGAFSEAAAPSLGNWWERLTGAASCQAAANARRMEVILAALRLTRVLPRRPQAPVSGEKTDGSARTSISCSIGVTFTMARSVSG